MREAELRAAAGRHGFAVERGVISGTWRLVDEAIGHAVYNDAARRNAFSLSEALRYFRALDRFVDPST